MATSSTVLDLDGLAMDRSARDPTLDPAAIVADLVLPIRGAASHSFTQVQVDHPLSLDHPVSSQRRRIHNRAADDPFQVRKLRRAAAVASAFSRSLREVTHMHHWNRTRALGVHQP